jgi:hypothetical protein
MNNDIIELLIHNFEDEKTLTEVREDYEDLELLIERELVANGKDSRRLAALKILSSLQLELLLKRLAETRDNPSDSAVSTK